MADEVKTDGGTNPDGTPKVEGQTKPKPGEEMSLADGQFDSVPKLEEGYINLHSQNSKMEQDNAELRKKNDQLQTEVLGKIADAVSREPSAAPPSHADEEARWAALEEQTGMERSQLTHLDNLVMSASDRNMQEIQELFKQDKEQRAEINTKLDTLSVTSSKTYQANQDKIEELVKSGQVTRQGAIELIDAGLIAVEPVADGGDGAPGPAMGGGSRRVEPSKGNGEGSTTDEQKVALRAQGFTEEEIATVR